MNIGEPLREGIKEPAPYQVEPGPPEIPLPDCEPEPQREPVPAEREKVPA